MPRPPRRTEKEEEELTARLAKFVRTDRGAPYLFSTHRKEAGTHSRCFHPMVDRMPQLGLRLILAGPFEPAPKKRWWKFW